ncbi:MAG: hypothetical protein ABGY10_01940 [bacterium]
MAITIDPKATHATEKEGATFHVRAMTGRQVLSMSTRMTNDGADSDLIYEVITGAVSSWEGVLDGGGAAVPCDAQAIEHLPLPVAIHLFEFITGLSGLTGEEAGN